MQALSYSTEAEMDYFIMVIKLMITCNVIPICILLCALQISQGALTLSSPRIELQEGFILETNALVLCS
jgi:hypothetical protein